MTADFVGDAARQLALGLGAGCAGFALLQRATQSSRMALPGAWHTRVQPAHSPLRTLGMALCIAFAGFALVLFATGAVTKHLDRATVQAVAGLGTQIALIAAPCLALALARAPVAASLGLHRPPRWADIAGVAPGVLLAMTPVLMTAALFSMGLCRALGVPYQSQDVVQLFAGLDSWWTRSLWLAMGVVGAPLAEEVFFRGFLYPAFKGWTSRVNALVFTSLLFGSIHMSWAALLPLAVVGAAFALAYELSGSLWTSIAAHALFNAVQFAMILCFPEWVK
jgi:hypothetical protein